MKQYIRGYYCKNEADLQYLNKDSNKRILDALLEAYPYGLTANQIAEKTNMPVKTVYSQLNELSGFIDYIDNKEPVARGRPSKEDSLRLSQRKPTRYVIENKNRLLNSRGLKALAPGNVEYVREFKEAWQQIVEMEERDQLCSDLIHFLEKIYSRVTSEWSDDEVKNIAPSTDNGFCCSQCGLNHEARDFFRAILLYLIDEVEGSSRYIEFLKKNKFIAIDSYNDLLSKTGEKRKKDEIWEYFYKKMKSSSNPKSSNLHHETND